MAGRRNAYLFLAFPLAILFVFQCCGGEGSYKVIKKEVLGGDGSWDYVTVDPDARRGGSSMAGALARVWDDAFTWFGTSDDPVVSPLVEARLISDTPDGLRKKLRARLEPVLDGAGVSEPLLARALPWDRWDPTARRLRG